LAASHHKFLPSINAPRLEHSEQVHRVTSDGAALTPELRVAAMAASLDWHDRLLSK
jgi:hypothetical protein